MNRNVALAFLLLGACHRDEAKPESTQALMANTASVGATPTIIPSGSPKTPTAAPASATPAAAAPASAKPVAAAAPDDGKVETVSTAAGNLEIVTRVRTPAPHRVPYMSPPFATLSILSE